MDVQITPIDGLLSINGVPTSILIDQGPFFFHSQFHKICCDVYSQINEKKRVLSPLNECGFGVIKGVIKETEAHELSRGFSRDIKEQKLVTNIIIDPSNEMREQIIKLIYHAFSGGLSETIENHLGCNFRIDHIECLRTRYSEFQGVSFRWHRDLEPVSQMHVVLYLTPCTPSSPATVFTSLSDTRRAASFGYSYPELDDRVSDINSWLPRSEVPIEEIRPTLNAGDATLFDAPRILHRGDVPVGGPHRDVLLLNILPSLNPWDRDLGVKEKKQLFCPRDTLWTNPFLYDAPPVDCDTSQIAIPDWVKLSHYFPL